MNNQTLTEQLLAERDKGPIDRLLVKAAKSDIEQGIDTRSSASGLQQAMLASQNIRHYQQGLLQNQPFTTGMMGAAPVGQAGLLGLFGASIY